MLFDIEKHLHLHIPKTQKTMTTTPINNQSVKNQLITILNDAENNGKIRFIFVSDSFDYCENYNVGITFKNRVWHWFQLRRYNNDSAWYVTFVETTSTNTGKTKKGFKHQLATCVALNKKFNTNIF
jgi:hypothetical protein